MDVIDLTAERNKRAQPDPEHIRHDEYGRPLYEFLLSYDSDGKSFSTSIWAYDEAEAQQRVEGMRASLRYNGQVFSTVPA
jgi:hypothetical protein